MRISAPVQALRADRGRITGGPDPSRWLIPALAPGWRLHTFHFFVDWATQPPKVRDDVWFTRLVHFDSGEAPLLTSVSDIGAAFAAGGHAREFNALAAVCTQYGQRASAVLLPEIPAASITDATPVWLVTGRGDDAPKVQEQKLTELKSQIQELSGGPVRVGAKGLIYGTSAIECALSRSDAAYPGDADAVIVDASNRVRCIVEFKKHTLRAAIGDHLFSRYYPNPDGRKYQRLWSLVSYYRRTVDTVPFVILYYSTVAPQFRLQLIGGLRPDRVEIERDSGDLQLAGLTEAQIASRVVGWLGLAG